MVSRVCLKRSYLSQVREAMKTLEQDYSVDRNSRCKSPEFEARICHMYIRGMSDITKAIEGNKEGPNKKWGQKDKGKVGVMMAHICNPTT